MSRVFILAHQQARRNAMAYLAEAPAGWLVKFGPPAKTREQEKVAHSIYADFAASVEVDGKRLAPEDWKEKLKLEFYDETGSMPEYAEDWRGLEPKLTHVPGSRFVLATPIQSSRFPRRLYAAFIEYLHARGNAEGVQWSATSLGREALTN